MKFDELSVSEWARVCELVQRAAEPMLGEVVVSKNGTRIGLSPVGNDEEKPYELSLDALVEMHRAGQYDDLIRYVHVTCAVMNGKARPPEGRVVTLADGFCYVWRDGDWHRMFA